MQAISYPEPVDPNEEKRLLELRLFNAKTKEELQSAILAPHAVEKGEGG